ncbi:hypothetical protein [Cupriavidus oxalaticus]|uniref:Uncharacterized protein n=1 Tax=Cupriavidus oxalaticus TaxID=96344 RepID=A0A5P3VLR3_9BURK|nr:hypothetical protein [Cupriavidus oxalaticus]QEZ46221.1 hypothetical protein D2917_18250 [Cupriavidus oxalaticus]
MPDIHNKLFIQMQRANAMLTLLNLALVLWTLGGWLALSFKSYGISLVIGWGLRWLIVRQVSSHFQRRALDNYAAQTERS